jgi:hypothetical protein
MINYRHIKNIIRYIIYQIKDNNIITTKTEVKMIKKIKIIKINPCNRTQWKRNQSKLKKIDKTNKIKNYIKKLINLKRERKNW